MKNKKISNNVIRRLPRYLEFLNELFSNDVVRVSSSEMAKHMGLTASQIRQDFSCFGEFGQQGYGYNVEMLMQEISSILGIDRKSSAILVGDGRMGHSLIENFDFLSCGFELKAAFDIAPDIVGTNIGSVPVLHMDELESYLKAHPAEIAVLTVPRQIANESAQWLVSTGIRGIWNFTNIDLKLENSDVVVESIHFSDSLLSLSYYLNNGKDLED